MGKKRVFADESNFNIVGNVTMRSKWSNNLKDLLEVFLNWIVIKCLLGTLGSKTAKVQTWKLVGFVAESSMKAATKSFLCGIGSGKALWRDSLERKRSNFSSIQNRKIIPIKGRQFFCRNATSTWRAQTLPGWIIRLEFNNKPKCSTGYIIFWMLYIETALEVLTGKTAIKPVRFIEVFPLGE